MKKLSLAVALGLGLALSTPAIEVTGSKGQVTERDHAQGTITHIDSRSITIHWMAPQSIKMRAHSYEQTYQLTPSTQYRDCTLASLTKGSKVRIWGHGLTADAIQIAAKP